MNIDRRLLYTGVFLIAVGGVLVAADLRAVEAPGLTDVLGLWPVAMVVTGFGLVLRRTQFSLPGGLLAAAVPGLFLGGALAVGPRFTGDCGATDAAAPIATQQGTFDGPATVSVTVGCGSVSIVTAPGSGWQVAARGASARAPEVHSSARSLAVDANTNADLRFLGGVRNTSEVTLPTARIDDLSVTVNAGRGSIVLPGAQMGNVTVTANAGQVDLDASGASLTGLSATVNGGLLSVDVPAGSDVTGSIRVNAGALRVCAPPGVALRLRTSGVASHVSGPGMDRTGAVWESPGYAAAAHHADLRASVNFGSVEIDPIGGCR